MRLKTISNQFFTALTGLRDNCELELNTVKAFVMTFAQGNCTTVKLIFINITDSGIKRGSLRIINVSWKVI